MAIKAIGFINAVNLEIDGTLSVFLRIADALHVTSEIVYTGVDPGITDLTLNADLKAFIQSYAETNWGTEFGMFDSARLIIKVSAV